MVVESPSRTNKPMNIDQWPLCDINIADSSDSSLDYGSANEDSASAPRDDSLVLAFNDFNLNTPKSGEAPFIICGIGCDLQAGSIVVTLNIVSKDILISCIVVLRYCADNFYVLCTVRIWIIDIYMYFHILNDSVSLYIV